MKRYMIHSSNYRESGSDSYGMLQNRASDNPINLFQDTRLNVQTQFLNYLVMNL